MVNIIQLGGDGHSGNEIHHYYRQDTAPVSIAAGGSDRLQVGDIWSDTTAVVVKRCTSVNPDAFTSIEGNTHDAVTLSGTPDYITLSGQDIVRGLIVLTTDVSGTLPLANGGTALTAAPQNDMYISAAAMKGLATAGAGDVNQLPESRELATNDINIDFMAFDPDAEQHAYFWFVFPKGWNDGTITAKFYWTNAAGLATETVDWGIAAGSYDDNDALDAALGTEVTTTDTFLAQDNVHESDFSSAVTIGGSPAEFDQCVFVIARKVGSDDLTGDAELTGVLLHFTRDSYTDA